MSAARLLPAAVALAALVTWGWLALQRVPHPFELEWMEGGMLQHVQELRAGRPLFVPPRLDFAPFPYAPLYVEAAALLPEDPARPFLWMRLLAVAGALALFAAVAGVAAAALRRAAPGSSRGDRALAGLLAAGLFAAASEFTGMWLDLARVDGWSLALGTGAWWLLLRRAGDGFGVGLAAGLLAALSCATKQSGLQFSALLLAPALARGPRSAGGYLVGLGALLGALAWRFHVTSNGLARRWMFDLLVPLRVHEPALLGYWIESALALGGAGLVVGIAWRRGVLRPAPARVLLPVAALLITGWIGRLHQGGFDNNLLPTALAAAVLFGPAAVALMNTSARGLAALGCAAAFLPLAFDPRPHVPTDADRAAGEALVQRLSALEGPLLIPDHGYLAARALGPGAPGSLHGMAMIDLTRSERLRDWAELAVGDLRRALRERRFGAVVLGDRTWEDELPALTANYLPPVRLWPEGDDRFITVSGAPKRPEWLYLRRPTGSPTPR